MLFLIILTLNLFKDYYNYTIFKNLHIFKIIKSYYLTKYKYFIAWKNSVYFFFILSTNYKKYYILKIISLFLICIGHSFFLLDIYDYYMQPFDLSDPIYENLEPSFNITDPKLTSKVPSEMTHDKIQKNENFYTFLFLTVFISLVITINK